jgi:hypothetical protein
MTSPLQVTKPLLVQHVAVWQSQLARLSAECYQELPGVSPYHRRHHACLTDPEELAIFADDVRNDFKSSSQLWLLALEDLTAYQPSIFE